MAEAKALTPRATDFSAWYNELVARAELADARGARVAIVVGPDDRARGEVMVKDLRGKGQVPVARTSVRDHVAGVVRGTLSP